MFDEQYPTLAAWILDGERWIELGRDEMSNSYIRILDIGGLLWESEKRYKTVAEMLAEAEIEFSKWVAENL